MVLLAKTVEGRDPLDLLQDPQFDLFRGDRGGPRAASCVAELDYQVLERVTGIVALAVLQPFRNSVEIDAIQSITGLLPGSAFSWAVR